MAQKTEEKRTSRKQPPVPAKQTRRSLGQMLVASGDITRDQFKQAAKERTQHQKLSDSLLGLGFITEKQLIKVYERDLGIKHISLYNEPIRKSVLNHVSYEYAQDNLVMPFRLDTATDTLFIAMHDPLNYYVIDNLELSTGLSVRPFVATRDDILYAVNKHYARQKPDTGATGEKLDESVVRLFDQILATGVQLKASDIHVDPEPNYISIRYRIDGQLRRDRKLTKNVQGSLIARIKIMAELDITQTRTPQDGRFDVTVGNIPVDLRVSILPTVDGEKVVIRLLDLSDATRKISDLGFTKENRERFVEMLKRPSGLILVTGPTGSGKSSTLYSSIRELNDDTVNIMTVEDPVELQVEGINQVQVNSESGLTFSAGLRSILRQDPNVIMIGEVRDTETAEIAIRSSLTGHLVLSTLHTNSAIDAVPRLVDMGVEPYLVASSVKGVVAQRLVRRICSNCRVQRQPEPSERKIFESRGQRLDVMHESKGCDTCHNSGYKGRVAVHEVIALDEQMKQILLDDGNANDLRAHAETLNTQFLLDDGLKKVADGLTSIDEVLKIAIDS